MPDLLKEMKEAIAEGVRQLMLQDRAFVQQDLAPTGRVAGSGFLFQGAAMGEDERATTGYDPVTGLTTVAFLMGVSPLGADDVFAS